MTATATCLPPDVVRALGDQVSWWLTSALFRDDAEQNELRLTINEVGHLTMSLIGPDVDAFGVGTAALLPVSRSSATCAATIVLTGYDAGSGRFHHLEAAIGATWALDRSDRTKVEVSGTALLNDVDDNSLVRYRAVRRHPFNHLDLAALPPVPRVVRAAGQLRSVGATAGPGTSRSRRLLRLII